MLVLSRKPGEKLLIGDIGLIIKKIVCGRVTIAIHAPSETKILRGEILDAQRVPIHVDMSDDSESQQWSPPNVEEWGCVDSYSMTMSQHDSCAR